MSEFVKAFVKGCIVTPILTQALSCKTGPGSDKKYPGGENMVYELRLSPEAGSEYHYEINNESEYKPEVDEKKVKNQGYMSGYQFTADLKGTEEDELQLEAKTGMLVSNDFTGDINGTMNVMSRNIPVAIRMNVKAVGKRIK